MYSAAACSIRSGRRTENARALQSPSSRFDAPCGFGPDWDLLEDPRNLAGPAHVLKPYMGSATGDFAMLDRESFHEIRGFNEVYRVARIGIDRNILVKVLSAGFTIADIGGPVYHENHEGSYRLNLVPMPGVNEAPWGDRRWHLAA